MNSVPAPQGASITAAAAASSTTPRAADCSTPSTSTAPSPTHATASLSRGALVCLVQFIAASGGAGGAATYGAADGVRTASQPAAVPFVSADVLFSEAIQPTPSASAAAPAAAFSQSALQASSSVVITRPLAFLAASPHCRRALEEHLIGGCVLAPGGALVLRVRWRNPSLASSSLFPLSSLAPGRHARRRGEDGSGQRRGSRKPPASSSAAVHNAQQLVVTSINVAPPPLSSLSTASCSPARSPEQRPRSAHVLAPPPLPLSPRQALHHTALSSNATSPTAGAAPRATSRAASASAASAEAQRGRLFEAPTPPRVSLSPVLQSRRAPVSALLGMAATSLPSSPVPPFSERTPPSPRTLTPLPESGAAAVQLRSPGAFSAATTSPSRSPSLAATSPRLLLPLPAALRAPLNASPTAVASTPPPALQSLAHAMWWVRRGPLPVSLGLARYAETDVQALWQVLNDTAYLERTEEAGKPQSQPNPLSCEAALKTPSTKHTTEDGDALLASRADAAMLSRAAGHTHAADAAPDASAAAPRALPSPVIELHVCGRAAATAITAILQGHPEVRAVRLTHTTLSSSQLRDLARHCPDVTHLSLAMNDHLRSTSFLCPTPSEASTVTTTTATTATTRVFAAASRDPQPPLPHGGSARSPRSSLLHQAGAAPASVPPIKDGGSSLGALGVDHCSASSLTTARSEGVVMAEGREGCMRQAVLPRPPPPPPPPPTAPTEEVDEFGLHNSQIDLFAAEEEGEAEMRLSLWQAAQTDAAERRQAVFILRPSDVVLGGAAAEAEAAGRRPLRDSRATPPPSRSRNMPPAPEAGPAVSPGLLTPLSPSSAERQGTEGDAEDGFSLASATASTASAPLPPSVSTATHHTDPLRSPEAPPPSVDAALAELRSALRWPSYAPAAIPPHIGSCSAATGKGAAPCKTSAASRQRYSTHWSETLVDLDLSYTQVLDEDAARDVPRLRMLHRLSLEGCTQLAQVRWVPSLAHLRELNLSFSSVAGSALHPLGHCAQLAWLKLEGCASFRSVDQLWRSTEEEAGDSTSPLAAAPPLINGSTTEAAATPAARVVRHRAAGGIAAITVLPPSAAGAAAGGDGGENEGVAEAAVPGETQTRAATTTTALPSFSSSRTTTEGSQPPSIPLFTTLRVLIVTGTALDDAGLQPVRHLLSLECLVVDRCAAVTDVNVAAQLPSLHTLDASRTSVTTEGLTALRHARTLRLLRLQGCLLLTRLPTLFVEDTAASRRSGHLAAAGKGGRGDLVCDVPGLTALDVSFCTNFAAGGMGELVVTAATARVRDAAAAVMGQRGAGLAAASAADTTRSEGSFVAAAPSCRFPQLRHLLLRSCEAVAELSTLCGFTQVVELDLYHTDVDSAALTSATARWTCLEVLNVASTRVSTLAAWCPAEYDVQSGSTGASSPAPVSDGGAAPTPLSPLPPPPLHHDWVGQPLPQQHLPAFAATLRVLMLSNTEVTSDGLAALRFFPQLAVLKLSNCRRLSSLSFLPLAGAESASEANGGRRCMRMALRELVVTEAAGLTNDRCFPFLAACPGLRSLSLAGCAQLGGGPPHWLAAPLSSRGATGDYGSGSGGSNPLPHATRPGVSSLQLPPLTNTRGSAISGSGRVSDLAVLRCMSGLTDLNLSRTAVNHDDLRAVFAPSKPQATHPAESHGAVRASTRLDLLVTPGNAAHPTSAASPAGAGRSAGDEGDNGARAAMCAARDMSPPPIERIWLRWCRFVDAESLAAAAGIEPGAAVKPPSAPASVREVYLNQGRAGPAVLSGLLL